MRQKAPQSELAPAQNMLMVLIGAPSGTGSLPDSGSLLVLEGDIERAQQLKSEARARPEITICAEVLSSRRGDSLTWHVFNDHRLSGPLPLEHWAEFYPNLREINQQERAAKTLEDILNAWHARQNAASIPKLHLIIRQGVALNILEGLGSWRQQLQRVEISLPTPKNDQEGSSASSWLIEQGFRTTSDHLKAWERDPIATLEKALKDREKEIAKLEEQLSAQAVRLLLAQEKTKEISSQHEKLKIDHEAATRRCNQLKTNNQKLRKQNKEISEKCCTLATKIDKLKGKQQGLIARRDTLLRDNDQLTSINHDLLHKHKELLVKCNKLDATNNRLTDENSQLTTDKEKVQERADALERQLAQINTELDEIIAIIDLPDEANADADA